MNNFKSSSRSSALFPPASVVLSRAWWFTCEHPVPVLLLGLMGSVPFAAPLVLYVAEAKHTLFLEGPTTKVMFPLALGLAGLYFVRFPFRLAMARWMWNVSSGGGESIIGAFLWSLKHLPTALLYGAVSTLGWILGGVVVIPVMGTFIGSVAFHRFACTEQSAWGALKESSGIPLTGIGAKLLTVATLVGLPATVVLWITPTTLLSLGTWLFKFNVTSIQHMVSPQSIAWTCAVVVCVTMLLEILWTVSFGLLSADWQKISQGADLERSLAAFVESEEASVIGQGSTS